MGKLPSRPTLRADRIWTPEDMARLAAKAPPQIMLAALTGLRREDLLRLSWNHVGKLAIELPATGKTGAGALIHCTAS